jgi:hypothetical protein
MIETIKTPQELEKEFYSKPLVLSYSGLNKLLFSPKLYYKHYVLQQREEKLESYLIDGKVIHNLLLDDGSFDKSFILLPSTLPTGNSRLVIDKVFEKHKEHILSSFGTIGTLDDFGKDILDILKEINLHQALKTDAQRFAKIITEETISYFEFLKVKGNKDLIDSETLQRCNEAVDVIKSNSKATELLGTYRSEMDNTKIHNELMLSIDQYSSAEFSSFGLRGAIDNMKIDFDAKIIYINDLKTTGKTVADFEETVKYYNYNLQAAIYQRLVKEKLKDSIDADWKIVFHFIVVDKYNQVYCFEVSPVTMQNWQNELNLKLAEAEWHYKNNKYNLPFKFETSQVTL